MKQGDIVTLEIVGMNSEGEGIARHGGDHFVVFVAGALDGERVKCRVVKVAKKYATARVLDIDRAAKTRVTPRCKLFYRCGGCQLQHTDYASQLAMKAKILEDALRRIAKIDPPNQITCAPSPEEWGYRNKTALPVQSAVNARDANGVKNIKSASSLCAGYFEPRSHRIVPFAECPVLKPSLERIVAATIDALAQCSFKGYDERNHTGDIRHIVARAGSAGGEKGGEGENGSEEVLSGLVAARNFNNREFGALRSLQQRLAAKFPELVGSVLNVKTDAGNFIWGPLFKSLCGKKLLSQRLDAYRFQTDISAFFQINAPQTERLFRSVRDTVLQGGASSVLELYSGVGSLTAYLADCAARVSAVEEWRPAVRQLHENLLLNGIENVTAHADSAEGFMQDETLAAPGAYDVVVLDPPRTGCEASVAAGIRTVGPKKIVYVSCNPATLARDLVRLTADGHYELARIDAFDMFPQTAHVESVAVLERR